MNQRVCAIIPAYNEEQTVASVVETIRASECVDEIIVVSDGSTDKTVRRSRVAGATVYERKHRHGKGQTLLYGISKTRADVLVFFDADLIGLTTDHIERILLPVMSGARVMNIALRNRGPFIMKFTPHLPLISGLRALRREVIERVPPEFMQGFMIETALNYYCRLHHLAYGAVMLSDLRIRTKYEKVGFLRGVVQYTYMTVEILQAHLAIRIANLLGKF